MRNANGVELLRSIKYCLGRGLELLSASFVKAVCHDSSTFLVLKVSFSMMEAFSKSMPMEWLCVQEWFAMLEPLE
mgnify:CR=1 FL=1